MLENIEGAIKNRQSRDIGNIRYTTKTQYDNMCWTPLYENKHK